MAQRIPIALQKLPKAKKAIQEIKKFRLYEGDFVQVINGPHRGKQGPIAKIIKDQNRVVVKGVNMRQRSLKTSPDAPAQLYMAESPLHYSNVNIVDPETGKPSRIGIRFLEDGSKVRIAKKSGSIIPWPTPEEAFKPEAETGPLDTPPDLVLQRTVE